MAQTDTLQITGKYFVAFMTVSSGAERLLYTRKPDGHADASVTSRLMTIRLSIVRPRQAVGSVVGIGGMFIALLVGAVLQATGSYVPIFILAGSTYLTALLLIQLLVPKLKPAEVSPSNTDNFRPPSPLHGERDGNSPVSSRHGCAATWGQETATCMG